MQPSNQQGPATSDDARPQADSKPAKTPNADMQAEDAGTAAGDTDSGTEASRAMKQTSKTASENKR